MRQPNHIFAIILVTAIAAVGHSASASEVSTGRAGLGITAHVRPVIRTEMGVSKVTVTASDVRNGFVELPTPVATRVSANLRSGFVVRYELDQSLVRSAQIGDLTVGPAGAFRVDRDGALNESSNVRLELVGGVTPGEYDFPVRITVHPLLDSSVPPEGLMQ